MTKKKGFKVGDKVEFSKFSGIFEIVMEVNGIFAVENSQVRALAKPTELKLLKNVKEE